MAVTPLLIVRAQGSGSQRATSHLCSADPAALALLDPTQGFPRLERGVERLTRSPRVSQFSPQEWHPVACCLASSPFTTTGACGSVLRYTRGKRRQIYPLLESTNSSQIVALPLKVSGDAIRVTERAVSVPKKKSHPPGLFPALTAFTRDTLQSKKKKDFRGL